MAIPVILAAASFALVAVIVGLKLLRARRNRRYRSLADVRSAAYSARAGRDQPVLGGLYSAVDALRSQMEGLRADLTALRNGAGSITRTSTAYRSRPARLPKPLQRRFREARSVRRLLTA